MSRCMPDASHEPRAVDSGGPAQPLATAIDATRDAAGRTDLRDCVVERRAGAEPAGAQLLRPGRRDLRWRAHADAGRTRWPKHPATTVCRSPPRRLAGVAGDRRSRPDRRAFVLAARLRFFFAVRCCRL